MSTRASQFSARVERRDELSPHLVRLTLSTEGFVSTGIPDEWVGLVVPGQFQSRYYTVRSYRDGELVLDVVVHEVGLVTEWVVRDGCVGSTVTITEPKGSYALPEGAQWQLLVGDLTGLPAMARIVEESSLPTRVWAEVPDDLSSYLPPGTDVSWVDGPLSEVVASLDWPPGEGYFWMAGESAQMRAIRKHLMRERGLPAAAYDVMGYWRASTGRQPRAVDPGPIWREGKAQGLSDEEIWSRYDEARS
ncbi:MAG TPA: siderophore-interacting protein [Nocardioides sp.]|uniref:siderophore-interacting protein n=1 Tax=uncultured Nocardioides sp. TaxID=198441 RepID=UPI000EC23A11|nr:siderophore-interacting protein [uncultured Nocardioides sp.]HCB03067.1 siderophore-interacting protein [Nocardioides sp.]HRI94445.1 siderophore-interacting protein [Nocardioides sp.]HRK45174.1 siderophore-interacting protein [Nocardioides sp.]